MIQNNFENAARDQSHVSNTTAVLESEDLRTERQVPWALTTRLQGSRTPGRR